jgi:hypothetical protein
MQDMFKSAAEHLINTSLFNPHFVNLLNSKPELILFDGGLAMHRDTKELLQTSPKDFLSFSTGYQYPADEISELRRQLANKNIDLAETFRIC